MQGLLCFLINALLQIYLGIFWKSVKISQNYDHEFVVSLFWPILYATASTAVRAHMHMHNISKTSAKRDITGIVVETFKECSS